MPPIPKIAITMGDPAGIGPEIIQKAYARRLPSHYPIIFGDFNILCETAAHPFGKEIRILRSLADPPISSRDGLNLIAITNFSRGEVHPGKVNAATGRAAGRYIEAAIRAAERGDVDAVVTCPIHKRAFHEGGYRYPGHTEMFADLTGTRRFGMMMVSTPLKVSLATIHLPLKEVPAHLTRPAIRDILDLTLTTSRRWFGIPSPRVCVLGLNPHAGEEGHMGLEERQVIQPVIEEFLEKGDMVDGPLPADTAFTRRNLKRYDAYVAMYHDQGLIPFKLLAFERGVNVTLGLPFPRVSVDHGTGLDIAGKGIADPGSLRSAIRWAVKFTRLKVKG